MGVPTIFQMWRDAESFGRVDLSSTRMALCGGAPARCRSSMPTASAACSPPGLRPDRGRPNCFSLTPEDTFRKAGSSAGRTSTCRRRSSMTSACRCRRARSASSRSGGPMVTLGYLRNPDATAAAFRGTRFLPHRRSRAPRRRGLPLHRRSQEDMFISGGENVYPAEVRARARGAQRRRRVLRHRRPRRALGRGRPRGRRAPPGVALDAGSCSPISAGGLARYKIPKSVVFTDALPRNSTGKVLRARCASVTGLDSIRISLCALAS